MKQLNYLYLAFLCIGPFVLFGQNPSDTLKTLTKNKLWEDRMEEGSVLITSGDDYSLEKTVEGTFIHKQYHVKEGILMKLTSYADKKMTARMGMAIEWHSNGKLAASGKYFADKQTGLWKFYSAENEKLEESIEYLNGLLHGKHTTYDPEGTISAIIPYETGKKHGVYKHYFKGKLAEVGIYEHGTLTKKEVIITKEEQNAQKVIEVLPMLKECSHLPQDKTKRCTDLAIFRQIGRNLKYPAEDREQGREGTVIISFNVTKEGAMEDIRVIQTPTESMGLAALEAMKKIEGWIPGTQNGEPAKVKYHLPINFRLHRE